MSKGYDPCLDLAEYFLEDARGLKTELAAARAARLARVIRDAIEAFLEDEAEEAQR